MYIFWITFFSFLNIPTLSIAVKYKFDGHPCVRECSNETKNAMTCGYNFILENYWTVSPLACGACPNNSADCALIGCLPANGIPRGVSVANLMLPGPAIRVCKGDRILVDVQNLLLDGQVTGIHWHGVSQRSTPWFDGVPGVTQCPITGQTHFRYEFEADSAGTFFWHAHSRKQRADGMFGSLVVRQPKEAEGNGEQYDLDLPQHEILLWDWLEESAMAGRLNHFGRTGFRPGGILVNGKGIPPTFWDNKGNATLENSPKPYTGLYELRVQQGKSYRWRIISNGVLNCPIEMSIDGHTMLVIATDGSDVTPTLVSSLVVHSGERWDVVVQAKHAIRSYWIKFRGTLECNSTFQLAVLNYAGVPIGTIPRRGIHKPEDVIAPLIQKDAPHLNSLSLAPGASPTETLNTIGLANLTSLEDDEKLLQGTPDAQLYISATFKDLEGMHFENSRFPLDVVQKDGKFYLPQLNKISNQLPPTPLLLATTLGNETLDRVCNDTSSLGDSRNCGIEHCKCNHVLRVKLNTTIEIILVDSEAPFEHSHVFHLHGQRFYVVAMESIAKRSGQRLVNDIKRMDEQELIHRRRSKAPLKDTVPVPTGGFTIIRFRTQNPGFWTLETQSVLGGTGMSLTLQVGNRDEMVPPPPNFPSCGNFRPNSNSSQIEWDSGLPVIEEEPTTTTTTTTTVSPEKEGEGSNLPQNGTTKGPGKPGGKKNGAGSNVNWVNQTILLVISTSIFIIVTK